VPQKPYTTIGTLREQVIYPLSVREAAAPAPGETLVRAVWKADWQVVSSGRAAPQQIGCSFLYHSINGTSRHQQQGGTLAQEASVAAPEVMLKGGDHCCALLTTMVSDLNGAGGGGGAAGRAAGPEVTF